MAIRSYLTFPDPVNEVAARSVASGVVVLAATAEITSNRPLLVLLTLGFLARVLSGPRFSLLGRFATGVVAKRWLPGGRLVPGPPKRFAQGIGFAFSFATVILAYSHHIQVARIVLGVLLAFAILEAALGFCAGCKVYGLLQRVNLVPNVCEECSDLSMRYQRARIISSH